MQRQRFSNTKSGLNHAKRALVFLALLLLVLGGLAIRRHVLQAQYTLYGRNLPFTLESALTFRYVRMVSEQGCLPVHDPKTQHPEGVRVYETYSIGLEYVWCWLASGLPKRIGFAERVRWVAAGWFCMGIVFIFAWMRAAWGSLTGAFSGAACYAVSVASVARSTGQELSDENFALPLVLAAFAAAAWAGKQARFRHFALLTLLAALLLAWAMTTWDLLQVIILFGAAMGAIAYVRGLLTGRVWVQWLMALPVLAVTGAINPYLGAHHFSLSYGMLLAYAITLCRLLELCIARFFAGSDQQAQALALKSNGAPRFWKVLALFLRISGVLLLVGIGIWLTAAYTSTYSHFLDLFVAKIRFLNKKPVDPGLLTFDQAILWTPALNSATFRLTRSLFPATLYINALGLIWALFALRRRATSLLLLLLAATLVAWPAFFLFQRFHVFVAILSAAWMGWIASRLASLKLAGRCLIAGLVLALVAEASPTIASPEKWGRHLAYYQQRQELVDWFRRETASEPVLANFGLSGTLLAYADCPIILHPKFENEKIRSLVESYGRALFLGDERAFRNWADARGAAYYVHSKGEFSAVMPELQMRYFVNALDPPAFSAARLLEFAPDDSRYFIPLFNNAKYRVYRIVTRVDEFYAELLLETAARHQQEGNYVLAESLATLAMRYDPKGEKAPGFLLKLDADMQKQSVTNHP